MFTACMSLAFKLNLPQFNLLLYICYNNLYTLYLYLYLYFPGIIVGWVPLMRQVSLTLFLSLLLMNIYKLPITCFLIT